MKLKITILFLFLINFAFSQTNISGGVVSGTWTKANSPYKINGAIMIADGTTLTIGPGVKVEFQGSYKFLVLGRLLAIGAIGDSITFTASDTAVGWLGIRFDNTPIANDSSKLKYCIIERGLAQGGNPSSSGGGIYFSSFSKVIVANSLFRKCKAVISGGGIYIYRSNPKIINCIFSLNNAGGGGGIASYDSSPLIEGNSFFNNNASGDGGGIAAGGNPNNFPIIKGNLIEGNFANDGGGIATGYGNPTIEDNIVKNNFAINQGGGVFCLGGSASKSIFNKNIITNNEGKLGGGIYSGYQITITNSIICNNESDDGGGIYCMENAASWTNKIINSIVVNNLSKRGGAFFFTRSNSTYPDTLTIMNTILWGNKSSSFLGNQIFLDNEYEDPNFYYCNIQGGYDSIEINGANTFYLGKYLNNIDADPKFVSPSAGAGTAYDGLAANWSLQSGSPCIDAGNPNGTYPSTDIAGNPRIVNNRIDMGAYEYDGSTNISQAISNENIFIMPNPNNGEFKIVNAKQNIQSIRILNLLGQTIFSNENINSIFYEINISENAPGVYFIEVNDTHFKKDLVRVVKE